MSAQVTGLPRQDRVPSGMSLGEARVWDPLPPGDGPPVLGTKVGAAPGGRGVRINDHQLAEKIGKPRR